MPKNLSNRTRKLQRQAKAHAHRHGARSHIDITAMYAALEQVAVTGHFAMAGTDGQPQHLPYRRVVDWHNAALAADGEPPLEFGELTTILIDDVMFGRLRLRPDGLWESDDDYFTDREPQR
jgi:hypothetical protein